jgi:hypothetical protein
MIGEVVPYDARSMDMQNINDLGDVSWLMPSCGMASSVDRDGALMNGCAVR